MVDDNLVTIHTPDDGELTARFDRAMDWPTPRVGETVPLTFWFRANAANTLALVVEDGETYTVESGTTESFLSTRVESGGTLDQAAGSTLRTVATRADLYPWFSTLRAYGDYPGAFWAGWTQGNRYKYREQLPSGYGKSSILLGVEPSVDLTEQLVPGVWGLVDGMADRRDSTLSRIRLDVELRVLARFERYESVSAVQNDLEA